MSSEIFLGFIYLDFAIKNTEKSNREQRYFHSEKQKKINLEFNFILIFLHFTK